MQIFNQNNSHYSKNLTFQKKVTVNVRNEQTGAFLNEISNVLENITPIWRYAYKKNLPDGVTQICLKTGDDAFIKGINGKPIKYKNSITPILNRLGL